MPAITPDRMVREEEPGRRDSGPNVALWFSEASGLTRLGAVVQIMPPGSRSAGKHWRAAEDEMLYAPDGEVTLHEGDCGVVRHRDRSQPEDTCTGVESNPLADPLGD